jgi:hypothetical protein
MAMAMVTAMVTAQVAKRKAFVGRAVSIRTSGPIPAYGGVDFSSSRPMGHILRTCLCAVAKALNGVGSRLWRSCELPRHDKRR